MGNDFECFASNSPDALAAVAADGRIVFANPVFAHLFMREGEGAENPRLDELQLSAAFKTALVEGVESSRGSGVEEHFICSAQVADKQRQFLCRTILSEGPGTEPRVLVELRDARGLRVAERARRRERAERFQKNPPELDSKRGFFGVLDEFPAFVYMQRQDYTVAYANKKVRDLYGETELRLCYEVFAGRTSPCPVCPTFEVFESGKSIDWEFIDEKGRTFRIYDYPFEDETGELLVMELGIDLTDLKRIEKELFQVQKLRAIGVLAGGLAHDLNNNLIPIIFNIDHALNRTTDAEAREPLGEALQAAYRAARLVEQVLEYSRQQEVSRSSLHLTPLLREIVGVFSSSLRADITCEIELAARCDCVSAHPAQVQQVLMNLLQNAEQAMPEGGAITVALGECKFAAQECAPHPELSPGEFVMLTIRDSGVGIEAEDVERVFEPFFTTKKSRGGTGMGLALVHSVVSSSGGAIHVTSTPGEGTVFTLYFPKAPTPSSPLAGELCVMRGEGNRLLLVDDDLGALSALTRTLRNAGFEVETAKCGEEGLARFAKDPSRYALVLADQSMPGMNGLEMSRKMLALDREVRIVICTGHVEPELEKQAKSAGIAGFAIKPMTPYSLVDMARKYCSS